MSEQELLADCLRRLNSASISYYLTGSMASNYWGIPRTTHDLDFVIQLPMSAVARIVQAFSGDFYIEETAVRAAHQPPHQFNAIDTRSALKVDFWLPKPEPFDREMFQRRVQATLFGESAWIATAEDVILHKLLWNRISPSDRQLGDAAGIIAVQAGALDKNYLKQWSQELQLANELERLLSGEIKPKNT
ncbi:MAG TPA: hypothetical protein VH251_12190 [Verrucomicrobiae bacterium]|jgi:hypothetical protein|nr:hypothetical protein [Verrucomicrobiae bacterium]